MGRKEFANALSLGQREMRPRVEPTAIVLLLSVHHKFISHTEVPTCLKVMTRNFKITRKYYQFLGGESTDLYRSQYISF